MRALPILVAGLVACGGGATPLDMAHSDLATGALDFAGGAVDFATDLGMRAGDMAGACTPPTSGFYVATGAGALVLVSPDPNSWDGGKAIIPVDTAGNAIGGAFISVSGDFIYFNINGKLYQGLLSTIQNGKLTVTADGAITGGPTSPYYGVIAPNGGGGDLMVLYSTISSYLGELAPGIGSSMLTQSNTQFMASCRSLDFEGTVSGDNSSVTAVCGNSIVTIVNGVITGMLATTTNQLVGMQVYGNTTYVMDGVGNVYDLALNLIKKTRQCGTPGSPNYGAAIYASSL